MAAGATVVVAVAAVAVRSHGDADAQPATLAEAQAILARRCFACHSLHPTMPGYSSPAAGFRLDLTANVKTFASVIELRAVKLKEMPLGNATHMTQAERDRLATWTSTQPNPFE